MKRLFFILFLGLEISISMAQSKCLNIEDYPKHRFGIGATSSLFAGNHEMNNFIMPHIDVSADDGNLCYSSFLYATSNTFYSVFLSYQFHFADNWYASVLTKLNNQNVRYNYVNVSDVAEITLMKSVDLLDIEIPLMLHFALPISDYSRWNIGLGTGIKCNISKTKNNYSGTIYTFNYDYGFDVLETASPFVKASTGFSLLAGKHLIDFFLSYTYYLNKQYQLYDNSENNCQISVAWKAEPFSDNYLEVGMAFHL